MSEEKDDLIERLKTAFDADHDHDCDGRTYVCSCDFDETVMIVIEDAASEIQRLRGEVSSWQEIAADRQAAHAAQVNEAERLRGEVERLRDALAKIADGSTPPEREGHYIAHRHAVKLAREALSPPSPKAP